MTLKLKCLIFVKNVVIIFMIVTGICYGQIIPGQSAPGFSLKCIDAKTHDLSELNELPMVILYFFDVESRPSLEGLLSLDQLAKKYENIDVVVWGITLSESKKVEDFIKHTNPRFPVLLDTSGVSERYQARLILPTICILGPQLKLLDYFQGGGKTTEIMLMKLAERELQRKRTKVVKVIGKQVEKISPKNIEAKTIQGYAALKEGNLDEAEGVFKEVSRSSDDGEVLGKEGLVAVYARKGQTEKALVLADEVEQRAPDRCYVNVIKGDILFSQNKQREAEEQYQKAVQKNAAESYHKALAFNQLGRVRANKGEYDEARRLYDQAIEIDPYYIEATSNKGVAYEKEGSWENALGSYNKALSLNPNDTFAAVLAKKAEEMLFLQNNVERKKRIDNLVKGLADRYRSQKKSSMKTEDTWTSRPMVLTFVDFQEQGGLSERDGLSTVLTTQLADQLNASGRVQAVERVILEQLLAELNLGSSDLADSETALKLGKVLAAKIIGTGAIYNIPDGSLLSMRLIDTETSEIPKVFTRQFGSSEYLGKDLHRLNREILKTIIEKYPLQGYVVQISGARVMINLGSKQGVVMGTNFEVMEEQEPIQYKGKLLRVSPKSVAQIEVIQVEPDLCYAQVLKQESPVNKDDPVREKMLNSVTKEKNDATK